MDVNILYHFVHTRVLLLGGGGEVKGGMSEKRRQEGRKEGKASRWESESGQVNR